MPENDKIKIVISYDNGIYRGGWRLLLTRERFIDIVTETLSGLPAIPTIRDHKPDVLLIGMLAPEKHIYGIILEIRKASTTTKVLIIKSYTNGKLVTEALKAGVKG